MKDYIRKGQAIEVTLDNGKVVKCAAGYIDRMVEKLDIDEYDAVMTWCEDEGYLDNDEQNELCAVAKENKSVKIIGAAAEKPAKKTQKERTVKENPTKEMIIAKIAELVGGFAENVVVENKGKIVTFDLNGESFKVDLIQKRKPKENK